MSHKQLRGLTEIARRLMLAQPLDHAERSELYYLRRCELHPLLETFTSEREELEVLRDAFKRELEEVRALTPESVLTYKAEPGAELYWRRSLADAKRRADEAAREENDRKKREAGEERLAGLRAKKAAEKHTAEATEVTAEKEAQHKRERDEEQRTWVRPSGYVCTNCLNKCPQGVCSHCENGTIEVREYAWLDQEKARRAAAPPLRPPPNPDRKTILEAMDAVQHNHAAAARLLGITVSMLDHRIVAAGLTSPVCVFCCRDMLPPETCECQPEAGYRSNFIALETSAEVAARWAPTPPPAPIRTSTPIPVRPAPMATSSAATRPAPMPPSPAPRPVAPQPSSPAPHSAPAPAPQPARAVPPAAVTPPRMSTVTTRTTAPTTPASSSAPRTAAPTPIRTPPAPRPTPPTGSSTSAPPTRPARPADLVGLPQPDRRPAEPPKAPPVPPLRLVSSTTTSLPPQPPSPPVDHAARILTAVQSKPLRSARAVFQETGGNKQTVFATVKLMLDDGRLVTDSEGVYRVGHRARRGAG